jgi:hypothetical protein
VRACPVVVFTFTVPSPGYPRVVRVVRASVLLAALAAALAVPIAVFAGGSAKRQASPTFSFGRTGGNILPAKVTIGSNGAVTTTGSMHATVTTTSTPLRNGLAKLARAEGFFTMSTTIACPGAHPDVASRFVTVSAFGKTRTVTVHGTCSAPFEELYAVLSASVGVQ